MLEELSLEVLDIFLHLALIPLLTAPSQPTPVFSLEISKDFLREKVEIINLRAHNMVS